MNESRLKSDFCLHGVLLLCLFSCSRVTTQARPSGGFRILPLRLIHHTKWCDVDLYSNIQLRTGCRLNACTVLSSHWLHTLCKDWTLRTCTCRSLNLAGLRCTISDQWQLAHGQFGTHDVGPWLSKSIALLGMWSGNSVVLYSLHVV